MSMSDINISTDKVVGIADRVLSVLTVYSGSDCSLLSPDILIANLGLDSLDMVNMIMGIEAEFSIVADEDEIEKLYTVGELIEYVAKKVIANVGE